MAKQFIHYGVSLLLVQAALGCSPQTSQGNQTAEPVANAAAASEAATPATDTKLVVAFGDSLYAGYNLGSNDGFAPVLEKALTAQGIKASVFNAGVSGDTSAAGRDRLAFTLDGLPRKPDLVIVGLGGNDVLRGLDPAQTRANLDAILTELKKRGIHAVLTGMLAPPNMGADYAASFNSIYPDLAKTYDAPLDPFFLEGTLGNRALMLTDGIHPNEKGVQTIVDRVAPLIGKALAQT